MQLPKFIIDILLSEFAADEVAIIDHYWHQYSQMSWTNSSAEDFIRQGRTILSFCKDVG